jgi:hypothetical protein
LAWQNKTHGSGVVIFFDGGVVSRKGYSDRYADGVYYLGTPPTFWQRLLMRLGW